MYSIFLSIPLFTLWFCTSSSSVKDKELTSSNMQTKSMETGLKNFAVLELFTSQGCSSCPSADRLLEKYSSQDNVITLSFHVDYWNRLGWKDPFSSSEFTQRQYKYASALNSSVYTPQLVVNGESEMVGSDSRRIENTLKKVWGQNPGAEISIEGVNLENGKASVNYNINGSVGNSQLNIALVEKKTVTNIRSGENGGVTLAGNNVVRNFKTIKPVTGKGSDAIDVPAGIDQKNLAVVLYLQQDNSKIIAADRASL